MSKIFQEVFCETIDKFGLKIVWLSKESGINDGTITRFKTGKRDIYLESFSKIFEALPTDAKRFFLEKILGDAIAENISLGRVIDKLDPNNPLHRKQAADALRLIVSKFIPDDQPSEQVESRENTEELLSVR